jgi:sugar phosphate isomerase/epimerase
MTENRIDRAGVYSRRHFGKVALASLPAIGAFGRPGVALARQGKPNSVWGGVPFGIFAPYRFGPEASDLEGALKALVNFGVSQTELSNSIVERHLGAPQPAGGAGRAGGQAAAPTAAPAAPATPAAAPQAGAAGGAGRGRGAQTPEQQAAARAAAEQLTAWRTAVAMDKFKTVKKLFDDAGVTIYAYRLTLRADMPDAEYDYTFNAAKALGATQITMELPADRAVSKRIGDFAAKHRVNVGYHLHTTATITAWDEAMAQSPRNGLQLDIGHYVAGTGISPVPLIEKHHARIFSMHLKDRKKAGHDNSENMPWGQGDTPIADVLRVLKKNKWAIPVGIEFEYPVPAGSTWSAEIAKCVEYGKAALLG